MTVFYLFLGKAATLVQSIYKWTHCRRKMSFEITIRVREFLKY